MALFRTARGLLAAAAIAAGVATSGCTLMYTAPVKPPLGLIATSIKAPLTPDFRGRMDIALEVLTQTPPDVFNHNMETVARLYREARPGANYAWSLKLLQEYKRLRPEVLTKSGLMVGLGETKEEIIETLKDMRAHQIDMLTIGQYLAPSKSHLPVKRYVEPAEIDEYTAIAKELGFVHAACGPLERSSYNAYKQANGEIVK